MQEYSNAITCFLASALFPGGQLNIDPIVIIIIQNIRNSY